MKPAQTSEIAVSRPECPLCHTVAGTVTVDSLRKGANWSCTRCGQNWSAERLEAVSAYARYTAAHPGAATKAI